MTNDSTYRCSLIFNIAPLYRKSIFELIEKNFKCEWFFGENHTNIASCPTEIFSNVKILKIGRGKKNTYWLKRIIKDIFKKGSPENIIMLGEPKFMTSWLILIKNKLLPIKRRKRIVFWAHGWYGNETKLQNIIYKFYFGMADKVMFYGNRSRTFAINRGLNPEKLLVIHNSLNHKKFESIKFELKNKQLDKVLIFKDIFKTPTLPLIFYIGRLSFNKKLHQAIEAVDFLHSKGIKLNLLIIGDGPNKISLQNITHNKGLEDYISFYGESYDENETSQFIYLSDACVSPGHIGLTALHSIEMGVPVITHNDFTAQAPEVEIIIPGKTGELFERDNIEDLAYKIEKIIQDSKNTKKTEKLESFENIVKEWTPEYQLSVIKSAIAE